jgi:hypothetical protein
MPFKKIITAYSKTHTSFYSFRNSTLYEVLYILCDYIVARANASFNPILNRTHLVQYKEELYT